MVVGLIDRLWSIKPIVRIMDDRANSTQAAYCRVQQF